MSAREGLAAQVVVELEGIRDRDGRPCCNRFAINYADDTGHVPFDEDHRSMVERAVNSHAALVEALQAMLSMHDDTGCCWVAAEPARAALRLAHGETGEQA